MRQESLMNQMMFKEMLHHGFSLLTEHKETINALNVFPVPDGDTGTNMFLSLQSGIHEIEKLHENATVSEIAEALSRGLLLGARGNSGVILSQLFRGFASVLGKEHQVLTPEAFAVALQVGVKTAYQAVARPVEGTILTVAKEAANGAMKALKNQNATIRDVLLAAIETGQLALEKTPMQLPVLKQAGVVDSGGQGLIVIYRGFLQIFQEVTVPIISNGSGMLRDSIAQGNQSHHGLDEFGYCTEFRLMLADDDDSIDEIQSKMRNTLSNLGDSLLVVAGDRMIKVHVHTRHPGKALEVAILHGELTDIKIDNMTLQHQALSEKSMESPSPRHQCGLLIVATGDGILSTFRELEVDSIIDGGSSMNPSTQEIVAAIEKVHADDIFLLPNHKNVMMAAQQAALMAHRNVHVIPTTSIAAGLGATLAFMKDKSKDENETAMRLAMEKIKSGGITMAVRSTQMDQHDIAQGDYLGVQDGEVLLVERSRETALLRFLSLLCEQDTEICTVFFAQHDLLDELHAVFATLQSQYPDVEFELQYGGQPIYDYVIAAE